MDSYIFYPQPLVFGVGSVLVAFISSLLISCIISSVSKQHVDGPKKPSTLPYLYPFIRSTFGFGFGGPSFFSYASQFCRNQPAVRISLINDDIYLVKGARNIAEVFRNSALSVSPAYAIALKHCFGMKHKAVTAYLSDTSGSQPKPIKGSRVLAENRVMYMTHENLVKGLLMDGLGPTSDRFERILTTSLQNAQVEDEWTHLPDFLRFFEDHLGSAILESIFGQALLAENPGFVRDLWAYDDVVMGLAKRLPRWMIPKSYKLRDKLRQGVKKWHTLAKKFDARTCTDDPVKEGLLWGSTAMRERNKMLLSVAKQTEDSVASTDLGLIWATVTNVVPSSMTLALHLFRDSSLLGEARSLMAPHVQRDPSLVIDMRKIEKQPLLQSVYAETLRFGVQIHVPRTTPHSDLKVGGTMLPRGKMILTNTWLAHTDEEVWNTKGNAHPLETFWPQRFLIDPKDSSSGPTKKPTRPSGHPAADEGVQFSAEGLEGAWIPYGGGHHACPGRLLAKRIMLLSCTLMATMFDVEILASNEAMEFGSPRFGFGVRKPNGKIPFRIRRRRNVSFSV